MLDDSQSRGLVRELILRGPLSRTDLAKRSGLSQASLSRLLKTAVDNRLLLETDAETSAGPGRRARPLVLNAEAGIAFGVKLTASEIGVAAMNLHGEILRDQSLPLHSHHPAEVAEEVRDAVLGMSEQLRPAAALLGVGVTIGGSVDDAGRSVRAPFLGWRDIDFRTLLERVLDVPIVIENDVQALTNYEHWFGVARGLERFAVVTIGAGVGHGLVVDDHVVSAHRGGVGLAGHLPLDSRGPVCDLGHRGCTASVLTTGFLSDQYTVATRKKSTFDDLLRGCVEGVPAAVEILGLAAESLGKLLATVANLNFCSDLVLAGEGVPIWDLHRERIERTLDCWRVPDAEPIRVLVDRSDLPPWSAGAATIALQQAFLSPE